MAKGSNGVVNTCVRHKVRELRLNRKLNMQAVASRAGIPSSSYACMEGGYYNISLDNLFRILGVLEADISEVWPPETAVVQAAGHPLYLRRIQEFRLSEVISLSQAEGAALFSIQGGKCSVLLHQSLDDFLLDRVAVYLEDGRRYDQGLWFQKKRGEATYCLFLRARECKEHVRMLIEHYLVVWSNLFGGSHDSSQRRL